MRRKNQTLDTRVFNEVPMGKILQAAKIEEDPRKPFTDDAFRCVIKTMISTKTKRKMLEEARNAAE